MVARTRKEGSFCLLGETEQEYYKQCLSNIAFAKKVIKQMNEIAERRTEMSELCAQIIKDEQQIIRNEMERIRAEKNG